MFDSTAGALSPFETTACAGVAVAARPSAPAAAIARVNALIVLFFLPYTVSGRQSAWTAIVPEKTSAAARFNVGERPFSEIRRACSAAFARMFSRGSVAAIGPAIPAMMRVARISAPVVSGPRIIVMRRAAEIARRIEQRRARDITQRLRAGAAALRRPAVVMANAARIDAGSDHRLFMQAKRNRLRGSYGEKRQRGEQPGEKLHKKS